MRCFFVTRHRYDSGMFRLTALFGLAFLFAGCAASDPAPPTFLVSAGHYAKAFDTARDTLRTMQFELDRVDARAGVITTRPKHSAGIATPWDLEQSTLAQEWEDFTNEQYRSVRILFEPTTGRAARSQQSDGSAAASDLRTFSGDLTGTIIIVIERKNRPNWRIDTTTIRLSSFARDPLGGGQAALVPIARDVRLEGRLAKRIQRQLNDK